ncbi:MAG: hypothetical protein K6G38_04815 [Gammaproteobacteria bacterium]|nr:hypothetical protein [Gammaproteobacteria bacterium]
MKKLLSLLLLVISIFILSSCSNDVTTASNTTTKIPEVVTTTTIVKEETTIPPTTTEEVITKDDEAYSEELYQRMASSLIKTKKDLLTITTFFALDGSEKNENNKVTLSIDLEDKNDKKIYLELSYLFIDINPKAIIEIDMVNLGDDELVNFKYTLYVYLNKELLGLINYLKEYSDNITPENYVSYFTSDEYNALEDLKYSFDLSELKYTTTVLDQDFSIDVTDILNLLLGDGSINSLFSNIFGVLRKNEVVGTNYLIDKKMLKSVLIDTIYSVRCAIKTARGEEYSASNIKTYTMLGIEGLFNEFETKNEIVTPLRVSPYMFGIKGEGVDLSYLSMLIDGFAQGVSLNYGLYISLDETYYPSNIVSNVNLYNSEKELFNLDLDIKISSEVVITDKDDSEFTPIRLKELEELLSGLNS